MTSNGKKNTKNPLIRGKIEKVETLFIVGNGAIEGGTPPLEKTVKKAYQNNFFHFDPTLLGSISSLSCLSMQERLTFDLLVLYANGHLPNASSQPSMSPLHNMLWNLAANSYTFRKLLGDSYKEFRNSLSIKKPVWKHLKSLGISDPFSACVTTNWDSVLWDQEQVQTVAHLHGHCHYPESLILPTETIFEKALKKISLPTTEALQSLAKNLHDESECLKIIPSVQHYYRENALIGHLFGVENVFRDWLSVAKKIVIAGVAFNDYDHELINSIANAARENSPEITVINRATGAKTDKVKGLFPSAKSVTFIDGERA